MQGYFERIYHSNDDIGKESKMDRLSFLNSRECKLVTQGKEGMIVMYIKKYISFESRNEILRLQDIIRVISVIFPRCVKKKSSLIY